MRLYRLYKAVQPFLYDFLQVVIKNLFLRVIMLIEGYPHRTKKEVKDMERAVFYARVSTEQEEQLNAIDRQIEENRKAIKAKGWSLVGEYIDRGITGTVAKKRDEYRRLMDDLELDKFDIIVIKDQDRLMRNTKDWYIFVDRLVQTGKRLYMYLENKFYTPDDALITGIKAIIAEDFSRNLSRKIHNYCDNRLEQAKEGKTDFFIPNLDKSWGWKKENGEIVIDPVSGKARRLACDCFLQGMGSTETAKILNDAGYRNRSGREFKRTDIPRFVYDPKNRGAFVLNKTRRDFEKKRTIRNDPSEWITVEGVLPPIITDEEWDRLMELKSKRTHKRGKKVGKNIFSGKIYCGCCGQPYWHRGERKSTRNKEFYCCSNKTKYGCKVRKLDTVSGKQGEFNPKGCDNPNILVDDLMEIFESASCELVDNMDLLKEGMRERLESIKRSLLSGGAQFTETDLKKEQDKRSKLIDMCLDGIISKEELAEKTEDINQRIEIIKADLKKNEGKLKEIAEIDGYLADMDKTVADYLEEIGTDDKIKLKVEDLIRCVDKIIIDEDGVRLEMPIFNDTVSVRNIYDEGSNKVVAHFVQLVSAHRGEQVQTVTTINLDKQAVLHIVA